MKIAVLMLTRGFPYRAIGALESLRALESGENEITYHVRYDDDDEESDVVLHSWLLSLSSFSGSVRYLVRGPRPATLGEAWNSFVPKTDWDAVSIIADDVFCLAPNWDQGVKIMTGPRGLHAFSWQDIHVPTNITYPVFTRAWVEARGCLFPELFPFWFSETWTSQVYELALGEPMAIVTDMKLGGKRGVTLNMRDVKFWVDVWLATRSQRIAEADVVRHAMGWHPVDTRPIIEKFKQLDECWNIKKIEEAWGDRSPPSPQYILAKDRARRVLDATKIAAAAA